MRRRVWQWYRMLACQWGPLRPMLSFCLGALKPLGMWTPVDNRDFLKVYRFLFFFLIPCSSNIKSSLDKSTFTSNKLTNQLYIFKDCNNAGRGNGCYSWLRKPLVIYYHPLTFQAITSSCRPPFDPNRYLYFFLRENLQSFAVGKCWELQSIIQI